ncbi:UrcA family protein [Sphingomonas sp. RB56-2]|uniref:UrcA family protein n=1 Tax=Sphingomonas brevis TaxID=2908206 RepID=A0ABT0S958_9SPHN|nr:UrcA family protein [Sphingomonas brevis]MCL6740660.1 UrcA family protein [Sphingomonas brevis]
MTKIFFAALLAFTTTPALAEQPAPASSIVRVADLDLSTSKGQQALDHRLTQAVKEVCGTASPSDLAGQNRVRDCRVDTLASLSAEREQRIASASGSPIEIAAR